MAQINDVQSAIDKINTNIAALKDEVGKVGDSVTQEISRVNSAIASLQQQIGGGNIKPADLDPIVTQLNEAAGNLGAAVTQLQTAQSALDIELVAPPVATTTVDPAPTGAASSTDPATTGAADPATTTTGTVPADASGVAAGAGGTPTV